MKPALIATDLDGTFLGANAVLLQSNLAAARRSVEEGVVFVIATGRPRRWLDALAELRDLDPVAISSNGAAIGRLTRPRPDFLHPIEPERALAFSDAYEGVELRDREWSEELLDALPRELRETEAARMAALPANQGRGDQLRLAACLALGEAITVAEPCLNSSDADERGAAWRAILASALRSRDPREIVVAFARIEALAGEQDPVRNAATSALAVASGRTLDLIPIERLKKLAGILTDARDPSPRNPRRQVDERGVDARHQ